MRKCDSCLYGEKLYDGTLICQHIVSMQGREATQDYVVCNRVAKCDFFLETNVKCSDCQGSCYAIQREAIVSKVKAKITEYMERGDKIIFTRDTHRENYLETLEGKNLPVEHCIYGTEGWRIIPELVDDCKEYPDCSFIDKVTFGYENWKDIFGTVDEYGIELVGLCTDICVVSNALALRMFYPSWNISVDESCCAGVTTKKHKAALEVMKSCQIEVTNSQKTK